MIEYSINKTSAAEIAGHLLTCNADFVPPLRDRVEITGYAQKIASKAIRFEAWSDGTLVGLVAAYCNDQQHRIAYITSVSVLREWMGKGVGARLMSQCVRYAKAAGMWRISLEVAEDNSHAITLYEKSGFVMGKAHAPFITMHHELKNGG